MSIQELRPVRKIVYARVEVGECENWNEKIARERLFTHALKQSGNIAYAWIEAGKTLSIQRLNQVGKIGYAGIETS